MMPGVTHPSPTCTLVQLTDLHIVADGEELPSGVDTAEVLAEALRAIEDSAIRPAALVLTGDLAEHGRPAQYRRLRAIVEPVAARLGATLVYAAGNHDDRSALREHLLDEPPSEEPLDHSVRVGIGNSSDLRIVVLDSTIPGHGHGELRPQQLDRLRAELSEPAPAGTVLALHHPPLPSAAPLAASIPLLRRDELAATIVDPFAPGAALRGLAIPSVSRIDLFPHDLITTSVPIGARRMSDIPAATMEPAIAAFHAAWTD
jgi:Icc protein